MAFSSYNQNSNGFTLVELAIVLVIIGLIVGSVLVGSDMISAARVRAQISQLEKYAIATRVFQDKYGGLPGDIRNATTFGFVARGTMPGQGDGNGLIKGNYSGAAWDLGYIINGGEPLLFWRDLSAAGLIDATLNTATATAVLSNITNASTPNVNSFFPVAKSEGEVYMWSGGWQEWVTGDTDGVNYFGIAEIQGLGVFYAGSATTKPSLTIYQAFNLDTKMDDGFPQTGRVLAMSGGDYLWANNGYDGPPTTAAFAGSSTSCFDNDNTAGKKQHYSLTQSNGRNCLLSFGF